MVLMLSRNDIKGLITMPEAIDTLKQAFGEFSKGAAAMPVRSVILAPQHEGWFGIMPAYLYSCEAMGLKSVTVYKKNAGTGLPAVLGVILLLDPTTGAPLSVMEAGYLTGVRTAAASGVATDILARQDANELALIGAGVQCRHHLVAMTSIRPLQKVRVFDVTRDKAELFRQDMQPTTSAIIEVVGSPEDAIRGADLVVTTSTSRTPVVEYPWLKPGAHINGVGSHSPDTREIAGEVIAKARVVVDSREAALTEAGDLMIPVAEGLVKPEQVSDEIGEVLNGAKPGRTSPDQITVYKSVGIAIEDMAVAKLVYDKAISANVGTKVDLIN
ncbi:MAG: ornithine cyclodeaminase family protein [Chloroflexota bacterium]|jgi:ornithine cyclodeaminase